MEKVLWSKPKSLASTRIIKLGGRERLSTARVSQLSSESHFV